jgi:hypothetical protein
MDPLGLEKPVGGAKDEGNWRAIMDDFSPAVQLAWDPQKMNSAALLRQSE